MIDFIQANFAAHPILTMAALIWAFGNVTVAAVVGIAIVGAWLNSPFVDHPEPHAAARKTKEVSMKKRIAFVGLLAVLFASLSLIFGCTLFGGASVEVALETDDGRKFVIHQTPDGIDIQGEFFEPHTGFVFVLGEGIGNLTARDPRTGLQVTITPKAPHPQRPPEAKATQRHVHEAVG